MQTWEWPIEIIVVFLISSFYLGYNIKKIFTSSKKCGCGKCKCGEK